MIKATSIPTGQLTIYVAPKHVIAGRKELLEHYDRDQLYNILAFVRMLFDASKIVADWSAYGGKGVVDGRFMDALLGRNREKKTIIAAVAILLSDERNVRQVVDQLSSEEEKLWRSAFSSGGVSEDRVRAAFGISAPGSVQFIDKPRFSWLCPTEESVDEYKWSWNYRRPKLKFEINDIVRHSLVPIFFPNLLKSTQIDKAPRSKQKFLDVEGALKAFASLRVIVASGAYDSMQTSKVTVPSIKKVAQFVGLSEFFPQPDSADKYRALARARIVANMLLYVPKNDMRTPVGSLREAFKRGLGNGDDLVRAILLPQLKGKFSTNKFDTNASVAIRKIMQHVAAVDDKDKWIDAEAFVKYVRVVSSSSFGEDLLDRYDFERATLRIKGWVASASSEPKKNQRGRRRLAANTVPEHSLSRTEMFDYLMVPIIKGAAFLLAALGCAEIAYDSSDDQTWSPFAGLACWRLTDLGRFVLGITNTYECSVEADTYKDFALDDRYLLITLANPSSPMRGLLDRFAKPVSGNRYEVTAETFLRECSSIKGIEDKIKLIRDYVCKEPPQVWLDFFDKISKNVEAVKNDSTKYDVYTIDPADRELQQYVAQSPEMRPIAICAQGFRVMVAHENNDKFRMLLRAHGYLI